MANKEESFEEFQQLPEEFSNHVSIKRRERRGSCESSENVWYVPIGFRCF